MKIMEFEVLFNEEKSTEELRNILPDFFLDLNELYWENILITIARLLDNHKQGQNLNLSLFALVEILKEHKNEKEKVIKSKLVNLKEKHKDIINFRSKHLAHFDLDYSTGLKDFNSSTHIIQVHIFLDSMIDIINETLIAIGENPKSKVVIRPGQYRGAREFLMILKNEKHKRN